MKRKPEHPQELTPVHSLTRPPTRSSAGSPSARDRLAPA
jgi:hypothetical protein